MHLESPKIPLRKRPEEIYQLLSEPANMKVLMPESVVKFEADADTFLFGLKGLPEIRLLKNRSEENRLIGFTAASSKLDFDLLIHIEAHGEGSELSLNFEGQFNPMMKMMVEKPLQRFLADLADKAAEI